MTDVIECLVGSYGQEKDKTLHWLSYDIQKNKLEIVNAFEGMINPSYLALDQARQNAYIISEIEAGTVTHYKIEHASKTLTNPSTYLTHGGPCYVGLNHDEDVLLVANYGGGSLTTYGLTADGQVSHQIDHYQMPEGSHLHTIRQLRQTAYYFALDLGRSEVICYQMAKNGHLKKHSSYSWHEATGPREIVFHPDLPLAYVVHEYQNIVSVLEFDLAEQSITLKQTKASIDKSFSGKNYGAAIDMNSDANKLYVSNRGHDSLTAFTVRADGLLSEVENYSVYGKWPRHFTTVAKTDLIFIANETTNEVIVMKAGEKLQAITVPQPVCIQVLHLFKGGE